MIQTFSNKSVRSQTEVKFVANETFKKLFKNHWKSKFNIPEIKKEEESVRKDKKLIET